MSRGEKDAFGGKLHELDQLAVKEPAAPPRAMAVVDAAELYDPRVLRPRQPGAAGRTGAAAVPARRWPARSASRSRTAAAGSTWRAPSPPPTTR